MSRFVNVGKGSKPRPVEKAAFDQNFEAIFGKKEPNPDVIDGKVRYKADPKTGRMIPDYMWEQYGMLPPPVPRTAFVQRDYKGYQSPITGKWIEGRRAHKYDLHSNDCRVYEGRDSEARAANSHLEQQDRKFSRELDKSLDQTLNDIKYQNNPPPETDKNGNAKISWTF